MQLSKRGLIATMAGLYLMTAAMDAHAQRRRRDGGYGYVQTALMLGGGVASYADNQISDRVDTGGTWDLRLLFGAHSMLGFEAAYVGTANTVDLTTSSINVVTSHGFEGTMRLSTPGWRPFPLQLYAFGGIGFARFDLYGTGKISQDDDDTAGVVPFGGGLQLNLGPYILADARFTYRAMFDDELFQDAALFGNDSGADMYTVTARLGVVF